LTFGQKLLGLRQTKWRTRQIDCAPFAGGNVIVDWGLGKGRRQKPRRARLHNVGERRFDMVMRQVHQAVTHQNHVRLWDRATDQVDDLKSYTRSGMRAAVRLDQVGDDIATQIVDPGKIDMLHPEEVATGHVQQRCGAKIAQQGGQYSAHLLCCFKV
jgi:hypothetical protein